MIDEQKILDFLGGDTVAMVLQRMKEFPHILGGTEIQILGENLRDLIRAPLSQQFGDASYLRNDGEFLMDESDVLRNGMGSEQTTLQKAYWGNFSILLGDHLGLCRINAIGYKLIGEPIGPIETVMQNKIESDVNNRLEDMQREIQETPNWLARRGLPEKGVAKKIKSDLHKKIEHVILSLERDKIKEFTTSGVDPKIAEARVLAGITKPKELTTDEIVYAQKRLEELLKIYPQMIEEYERLKPVIGAVVYEILNKIKLDHLMQIRRFSLQKK